MEAKIVNENTIMDSFEDFITRNYLKELANVVNLGLPALKVDFKELDVFDPVLTDYLIDNPTKAVEQFKIFALIIFLTRFWI